MHAKQNLYRLTGKNAMKEIITYLRVNLIYCLLFYLKKTRILLIPMFSHSGCPLSQLVHRCPNLTNFIREHKNTNANTNFVYHVSAHAPNEEPLVNSCANTKYTKTQHKQPHNPFKIPDRRPNVCGQAGKHKT